MKKLSVLCIALGAGAVMSQSAFADEAVILSESFTDMGFWVTKSSNFSVSDGKLIVNTGSSAEEQTIYKHNGTNATSYFRTNIGNSYKLEADIQITDYFEGAIDDGYSAALSVTNAAYEMAMYIASDGIYVKTEAGTEKHICDMDSDVHTYKVVTDDELAEVYMDNEYLFDYEMPTSTGKDNIIISAKGGASDSAGFSADNLKLTKIYDTRVLYDDMKTLDNVYSSQNVECATYDSAFFSGYHQADLKDPTKTGEIVYKIPDGAELAGFTISARKHPQHQADIYLSFSADGKSWTKNYISTEYKYTWFYANGGHRYLMTPGNVSYSGAQYVKITIDPANAGGGGAASESSPSIMSAEIYYSVPEFKNVTVDGSELKDGAAISANTNEIKINFTAKPDEKSAEKNIVLKANGKAVDISVTADGNAAVLKINEYLDYGAEYTLVISDGIESSAGSSFEGLEKSYTFKTYKTDFTMENVSFNEADDKISATADIKNTSGAKKSVTLIIIGYKNGTMTGFEVCEKSINHGGELKMTTEKISADAETYEVMLWDNLVDMTALVPNYIK